MWHFLGHPVYFCQNWHFCKNWYSCQILFLCQIITSSIVDHFINRFWYFYQPLISKSIIDIFINCLWEYGCSSKLYFCLWMDGKETDSMHSNVQGSLGRMVVSQKRNVKMPWKSFHLRKLLPILPSAGDSRLSDTLDVDYSFFVSWYPVLVVCFGKCWKFDFSPLCAFKCVLKLTSREEA